MPHTDKQVLDAGYKATQMGVALNVGMGVAKGAVGLFSGSAALIADALHSIADAFTDLFAYFMLKIGVQAPDDDHPYGHLKFETAGTLILAVILAVIALSTGYSALENAIHGHTLNITPIALVVTVGSILINEFLYIYTKRLGEKVESPILIANAWHHRTDSLSSLAVLAGLSVSMLGFPIFDTLAALVVTVLLLKIAFDIGIESFHDLVDAAVDPEFLERLTQSIHNHDGVIGISSLRARRVSNKAYADVNIEVDPLISVSEGHTIAETLERALLKAHKTLYDITVHVEPSGAVHGTTKSTKKLRSQVQKSLSVHIKHDIHSTKVNIDDLESGLYLSVHLSELTKEQEKALDKVSKDLKKPEGAFDHVTFWKNIKTKT